MSFLAPLWLLGLLPWIAVAVWLLSGRRERTAVPFLELWRGGVAPPPKPRATLHLPPLSIVLILLGMLLAIVAAARPRVSFIGAGESPRIIVIVDRGITMSARASDGSSRWASLMENLEPVVRERLGEARIEYRFVPEDESRIIDTRRAIPPAIHRALREGEGLVLALTDQSVDGMDPRVIQIAPKSQASNVGIVIVAASDQPGRQVMVRVRNDSDRSAAQLKVGEIQQTIELPPRGQERNYFVDVDALDGEVAIELSADDDFSLDNRFELSWTANWPRIELVGDIAPEIVRAVEVYQKLRPPELESERVIVTTDASIDPTISAVIVPDGALTASGPVRSEDHPVTRYVDWSALGAGPVRIASAPGEGWQPVAWMGDRPILAVRTGPVRSVWVGVSSEPFPRSPDFVVLWANLFTWLGGDGTRYSATGISAIAMPIPPQIDWEGLLAQARPGFVAGLDISKGLALLAVGSLFLASLVWGVAKIAR